MFGRKKPTVDPTQWVSLERDGKVVLQLRAQEAKYLYDHWAGQWAPYKAHFSGKLVTAYQITEDNRVYTQGNNSLVYLKVVLYKGDMLYSDNACTG